MKKIYNEFVRLLYVIFNIYIKLEFTFNFLKSNKKILNRNKRYKNCNKGKRCFILGNGPSLKTTDLSILENEIVFSVNQISRNPYYNVLNPKYHFWSDPSFFLLDKNREEDIELLSVMKALGNKKNVQCFFPIEQKDFCEKNGLEKVLNISYFSSRTRLYDNFNEKIDFSKVVPNFGTVVQLCISMAIYMGFSEIYLLGCDNTGLMVTIKSALKCNDCEDYSYQITRNEKRRMESLLKRNSLEAYTKSYLNTLCDYRRLNDYCKKKGIKLINCSSQTVIDSLPRDNINNILDVGEQV